MNDRSRPAKAAPEVIAATSSSLRQHADIPAQLRRRRAASYRCPALIDGRRDPIDNPRAVRAVVVRIVGAGTTEVDGPGVVAAIRSLGIRSMRARDGGGWLIQGRHTDDLIALLEVRGYRIESIL